MRRTLGFLFSGLLALTLMLAGLLTAAAPAQAATIAATTTCSNGVDNTGGLGLICRVWINNTFTANGGSSRVTLRECHGAAGAPSAKCTTTVRILSRPVTQVTQCNSSINGGGGTLRCSVQIVNTFVGVSPGSSAATVNQCVGSGGGKHKGCDPFPATTSGATITQCNGSANGGTLVQLTCTATGSKSSAESVRVNQCNGSANGGGALVICSASIVNRIRTTSTTTTGSTGTTPGGTPGLPNTSTVAAAVAQPAGMSPLLVVGAAFAIALALMSVLLRTRRLPTRR